MSKFDLKAFNGVVPAMLTIFDKNEKLDEQKNRELVNWLISKGIDGLYLTGSTGQGFLMSSDERKKLVEIVIDEVNGRIPVMVHVGAIGTEKSIDLALHAHATGADAISSVPPFYWNFSEKEIYSYYEDISQSTPLPMVIYNVPLAGTMGLDFIKELSKIDQVKGIKYTATTHYEIQMIKDSLGEDFYVYSGCDEMALSGLMNGADGIIGSTYNVIPDLFAGIMKDYQSGEYALAEIKQNKAVKIIMTLLKFDFHSALRKALGFNIMDAGYCKKPFYDMTPEETIELKDALKGLKEVMDCKGIQLLEEV